MKETENLINLFKEDLKLFPSNSLVFDLDTTKYKSCWDFIEKYLAGNTDKVIEHKGQIIFNIEGNNVEKFICGVAPMWKEYENKNAFEYHYTNSEMMRELYCNEKEDNGSLVPIYISINNEKFIVTWESDKDIDVFRYNKATFKERGLLDVFFEMFGGSTIKDGKNTYKKLNPNIELAFDKKITNNFGFDLGYCLKLCEKISNLGYAINGRVLFNLN